MSNESNELKTISRLQSKAKLRDIINSIKDIVTINKLNPGSLRYVFKTVRKETKLFIAKRDNKLPDYFTPAETYQLMETASRLGPAYSLLVRILIQTGLRISELQNLDLRDIRRDDHKLLVRAGKGNKDRYVPIGTDLIERVFLYTSPRASGYIFVHPKTEKPLTVRRLQQMTSKTSVKAGLGVANPHKLRRTYACILINKGFRLEDLQLFMGHNSRITTEIYAKLTFTQEQKEKYLQLFP